MAATTQYRITYSVQANTRLQAILAAGALLRTGVRVLSLVGATETVPGWWDVAFAVEETLSDPPEPKWLHEDRHIGEGLSDPDCRECERGWQTWNLVGAW